MKIIESELNRWELSEFNSLESLWSERDQTIRLLWTPIEEMGVCIVNILSPLGHVFWNIYEYYPAFRKGWSPWINKIIGPEDFKWRVRELCIESCMEPDSFAAGVLFNELTSSLGPEFEFPHEFGEVRVLANRHMSLAIPMAARPAVSRYFHRQLESFAGGSLREFDEERTILPPSPSDDPYNFALQIPPEMMTLHERHAVLEQIQYGAADFVPANLFSIANSLRGVGLGIMRVPEPSILDEVVTIIRWRLKFLLHCGSIPALVWARTHIDTEPTGWNSLLLADLREECYEALDTRIAKHPIIQIDPFNSV